MRLPRHPAAAILLVAVVSCSSGCATVVMTGLEVESMFDQKTFHVTGEVVDEQGRPLEDVTVSAWGSRQRFSDGWRGSGEDKQVLKRQVDSPFSVRVHNVDACSVAFYKEGYYATTFDFGNKDATDGSTKDLRVVLERKGVPTELDAGWAYVEFELGVAPQVTRIPVHKRGSTTDTDKGLVSAPDQVIASFWVRVEPATDVSSLWSETSGPPVTVSIGVGSPDGGMQWASAYPPRLHRVLRNPMDRAPADGYEPKLLLRGYIRNQPFYFRGGGVFGRGTLDTSRDPKRDHVVTVRLTVEVQPDGSRNLETGR